MDLKTLIPMLKKFNECMAATTAALAPYPVTAIPVGKKKKDDKTKEHNSKNI